MARDVPLVGVDRVWPFYLIHVVALLSLGLSIIGDVIVLALIFARHHKISNVKEFCRRPVGERLIVYLATSSFFYCLSHVADHLYMIVKYDNPPHGLCASFAFVLNEFVMAQNVIITFTAVNAFIMVVKEKRVPLGSYDWKLLAAAFGAPLSINIAALITDQLGPAGAWCYINAGTNLGPALTQALAGCMICIFIFNIICYAAVWYKITRAKRGGGNGGSVKYLRSARAMMLFVTSYLLQCWAYFVYAIWQLIAPPHLFIIVCVVCFSNLGGVTNLATYLIMQRQKRLRVQPSTGNDMDYPASATRTGARTSKTSCA